MPLHEWGESGSEPGQLFAPFDLVIDEDGFVYVSDPAPGACRKSPHRATSSG
jgi:hypothetical protein